MTRTMDNSLFLSKSTTFLINILEVDLLIESNLKKMVYLLPLLRNKVL